MSQAQCNHLWADTFCMNLYKNGLRHVILSPGSRSTPLVLAFQRNPHIRIEVILDERTAGFYALGLARTHCTPIALLCTSGTAMAHYLPAVIEAHHSNLPLLLLTADRPPELHYSSTPQTMEQSHLFAGVVRKAFTLSPPTQQINAKWLASVAAQAIYHSRASPPGPVHINIPFRKPFWSPEASTMPVHQVKYHYSTSSQNYSFTTQLAEVCNAKSKGLLVCGPLLHSLDASTDKYQEMVTTVAQILGWPILADPLSRVRHMRTANNLIISSYDGFLRSTNVPAQLQPDIILYLGRPVTSKALTSWLQNTNAEHIRIDQFGQWHDPSHICQHLYIANPTDLFAQLIPMLQPKPYTYASYWTGIQQNIKEHLKKSTSPQLWEGLVAQIITEELPDNSLLHVASGMPVRDIDTFGYSQHKRLFICANRGVNGIDGLLATAAGQAQSWHQGPAFVLIGDLAFLHDLGSLRALHQMRSKLTIIVVDNGGGGIFENLPISNHKTAFEEYFLTPQTVDIPSLAKTMGCELTIIHHADQLRRAIHSTSATQQLRLLYIQIDRLENISLHQQCWQSMEKIVGEFPVSHKV